MHVCAYIYIYVYANDEVGRDEHHHHPLREVQVLAAHDAVQRHGLVQTLDALREPVDVLASPIVVRDEPVVCRCLIHEVHKLVLPKVHLREDPRRLPPAHRQVADEQNGAEDHRHDHGGYAVLATEHRRADHLEREEQADLANDPDQLDQVHVSVLHNV